MTINAAGQAAMDGLRNINAVHPVVPVKRQNTEDTSPNGSEVAKKISQNLEEIEKSAEQMQKMSDMVMGHKLQFKVNKELGGVVIDVVDPNTNKVLKEIPSEEMQALKLRMKQTQGLIFDELG